MELRENMASVRKVGKKGRSLKKKLSMVDTSRYRYLGCGDMMAWSMALMTRSVFLKPILHVDTKYSLASSMY